MPVPYHSLAAVGASTHGISGTLKYVFTGINYQNSALIF
jgi:hypothetical protein